MSIQEGHNQQQRQYYAYPNDPGSICQYNTAYTNCRAGKNPEELMHQMVPDNAMYWGKTGRYPQEQQQQQQQQLPSLAAAPVYGPSKAPRLHQFVDLATNSSAMTPFFALSRENCDEGATPQPARPADPLLFTTPQQKQRSTQHHHATPTPSSAMGMSVSPASTMDRAAALRTAAASLTATPSLHFGARAQQTALHCTPFLSKATSATVFAPAATGEKPTKKTQTRPVVQDSTEEKQRRQQDQKGKGKEKATGTETEAADEATATATTPAEQMCSGTERERRSRSGKETTRRGKKSKNNAANTAQQKSQCPAKNSTNRSLLESLAAHSHMDDQEDSQRFIVTLLCRGDRSASALSYLSLPIGTHVIFQGDRGNDLGEVISCEASKEQSADKKNGPQMIVRNATEEEVEEWNGSLTAKEAEAAEECRTACEEIGLAITVVGALFQFDRQKLTILYESDARVDFRELLQVMFSKYHCRIWMERVSVTSQ